MQISEAKTKICPFITYTVNPVNVSTSNDSPITEHSTCQTTDCMAWASVYSDSGFCRLIKDMR